MKLTMLIRQAFVRGVLDDVPRVDYVEKVRKLVMDDAISRLPPVVRKVWDDPNVRPYIHMDGFWIATIGTFYVPGKSRQANPPSPEAQLEVEALRDLSMEQERSFDELRKKLEALASSVRTTQALAKLVPEFAKYIPKEEAGTANVPMVINIVADLQAAGWPKDKPAEANDFAAAINEALVPA